MSIVIDANMKLFAERMHISSHRMISDYGLKTVDEIIEAEAERGNKHAIEASREYYHSPEKLIKMFRLTDVENKFILLRHMNDRTREKMLPLLEREDLVLGLNFFTQDKLLEMLMNADIEELVKVVTEAFPLDVIVMMFTEDELAGFMGNKDLDKEKVVEQMMALPPEVMQKFIEGITGKPASETNAEELIGNIASLPDDKFHKFMAGIDPEVQRQLTFQLTKTHPENLTLFGPQPYVRMLSTLMTPDMVKPMIMLNKDTLVNMISKLPEELMSIVGAQVDTKKLAVYLQKGNHMKVIEEALMI